LLNIPYYILPFIFINQYFIYILTHFMPFLYSKKGLTILYKGVILMDHTQYHEYFIELGLNIKYYRVKLGYTQQELADKVYLSKQQISRIESPNSSSITKLDTLYAIAEALDVDICQLLPSNKNKK